MSDEKLNQQQAALLAHVTNLDAEITPEITHDENGELIPQQQSQESAAAENKAILEVLVAMASPALPFLSECYTPDTIERIANAYTAVEQKYGWNIREHMGVEVQLAIVAIPPTLMAVVMGREYFKQKREAAQAAQLAQAGGDGRTE